MTERRNATVKRMLKPMLVALCLALLVQGSALALNGTGKAVGASSPAFAVRASLADEVASQVNQERAKRGLRPLRISAGLTRAARVRAGEITRRFSHTRPDGSSWRTVSGDAYGENIAMGQRTADKVMAAWMTSSGHRANILRASYGSIGVCAVTFGGVTYWAQLFGK